MPALGWHYKQGKGQKETTAMKITREMKIEEILRSHPETLEVFQKYELQCADCLALFTATVEGGARMHGLDVEKLLKDLNAVCEG